jgi:hypothetical protein
MSIELLVLVLAVIAFLLDAFRVASAVSWTPLGFALVTLSLII